MKNNRTNFLGRKRNESIISQEEIKTSKNEVEKSNENKIKKTASLIKPELSDNIDKGKNNFTLEEIKQQNSNNLNLKDKYSNNKNQNDNNIIKNRFCNRCGNKNNIIFLDSIKSILDYYVKEKAIVVFKINEIYEKYKNFKFEPFNICSDCLIKLSKNQNDFESFICSNVTKAIKEDINDNLFGDLLGSIYLKNFNNIEKNNINKTIYNNNINCKNFENYIKNNEKKNFSTPNNLNKDILQTQNNNLDYLNAMNNSLFTSVNYMTPFNQNISNLNIPNYTNLGNEMSNLFNANSFLRTPNLKENNINQSPLFQYQLLNYPNLLSNSSLRPSLITSNKINTLNLGLIHALNKNIPIEINNTKNQNVIPNAVIEKESNNRKIKEDINNSVQNSENEIKKDIMKNFVIIPKKEFDDIYNLVGNLFNKLVNIKICRESSLDFNNLFNEQNSLNHNSSPNFINGDNRNNETISNNLNLDLNQFGVMKNNLFSNLNTINNFPNISNINDTNKKTPSYNDNNNLVNEEKSKKIK